MIVYQNGFFETLVGPREGKVHVSAFPELLGCAYLRSLMFAAYLHCQKSPSVRSDHFCLAVLDYWSFLFEYAFYILNDYVFI